MNLKDVREKIEAVDIKQAAYDYNWSSANFYEGGREQLLKDAKLLTKALKIAETALEEVKRCEGAFSRDPYKHAQNVIENSERVAAEALADIQNLNTEQP
jgi:hypothetical protein